MTPSFQFPCPACGATLTLPAGLPAGIRGPCPHCRQIITSPEPVPVPPPPPVASPVATEEPPQSEPARAPEPAPPVEPVVVDRPTAPLPAAASPAIQVSRTAFFVSMLLLCCALAAVIAFAAGYRTATREFLNRPLALPVRAPLPAPTPAPAPAPAAAPAAKPVPKPAPAPTHSPPAKPAVPPEPPQAASPKAPAATPPLASAPEPAAAPASPQEAALRAFLTAPGWASRLAHVLNPEDMREEMARDATERGDGPIPFSSIAVLQENDQHHVFLLRSPAFPDGFPVVVAGSKQNGWLVDWQGFREFHGDLFQRFADEATSGQATFRLLLKPASEPAPSGGIARFRLSPPMAGRERVARVEEGSTAHEKLREILDSQEKADPEAFGQLMASGGLPLVITVSKRASTGSPPALWIEHIKAIGWKPELPDAAP